MCLQESIFPSKDSYERKSYSNTVYSKRVVSNKNPDNSSKFEYKRFPNFRVWEFTAQYIKPKLICKMSVRSTYRWCQFLGVNIYTVHYLQPRILPWFNIHWQQTASISSLANFKARWTVLHNTAQIYTSHLTFPTPLTMIICTYSKRCTPHSYTHNAKCISSVHSVRYMRPSATASCKFNTVSSAQSNVQGQWEYLLTEREGTS